MSIEDHSAGAHVERLLQCASIGQPLRNWSLIITVFGDAIQPRGGSVWLGSLTEILALFDILPGAVRTAMSRLTADGWVEVSRSGRNAFYRLTQRGSDAVALATPKIYGRPDPHSSHWNGNFCLAVIPTGTDDRPQLRQELLSRGFTSLSASTYLSVSLDGGRQTPIEGILFFSASTDQQTISRLAEQAFSVHQLAKAYRGFLIDFQPVLDDLREPRNPLKLSDETGNAFALRMLCIHAYRRIAVRMQDLPAELYPADWPGEQARKLMQDLYRELAAPSEHWLSRIAMAENGGLPEGAINLDERFTAY